MHDLDHAKESGTFKPQMPNIDSVSTSHLYGENTGDAMKKLLLDLPSESMNVTDSRSESRKKEDPEYFFVRNESETTNDGWLIVCDDWWAQHFPQMHRNVKAGKRGLWILFTLLEMIVRDMLVGLMYAMTDEWNIFHKCIEWRLTHEYEKTFSHVWRRINSANLHFLYCTTTPTNYHGLTRNRICFFLYLKARQRERYRWCHILVNWSEACHEENIFYQNIPYSCVLLIAYYIIR